MRFSAGSPRLSSPAGIARALLFEFDVRRTRPCRPHKKRELAFKSRIATLDLRATRERRPARAPTLGRTYGCSARHRDEAEVVATSRTPAAAPFGPRAPLVLYDMARHRRARDQRCPTSRCCPRASARCSYARRACHEPLASGHYRVELKLDSACRHHRRRNALQVRLPGNSMPTSAPIPRRDCACGARGPRSARAPAAAPAGLSCRSRAAAQATTGETTTRPEVSHSTRARSRGDLVAARHALRHRATRGARHTSGERRSPPWAASTATSRPEVRRLQRGRSKPGTPTTRRPSATTGSRTSHPGGHVRRRGDRARRLGADRRRRRRRAGHRLAQHLRHRSRHARAARSSRARRSHHATDRLDLSTRAARGPGPAISRVHLANRGERPGSRGGAVATRSARRSSSIADGSAVVAYRRGGTDDPRARRLWAGRCALAPTAARLAAGQCVAILARRVCRRSIPRCQIEPAVRLAPANSAPSPACVSSADGRRSTRISIRARRCLAGHHSLPQSAADSSPASARRSAPRSTSPLGSRPVTESLEDGRPPGRTIESDTGVMSADWQTAVRCRRERLPTRRRAQRREARADLAGSYPATTSAASSSCGQRAVRQLFGNVDGDANSDRRCRGRKHLLAGRRWRAQPQVRHGRALDPRTEGTISRNADLLTQLHSSRRDSRSASGSTVS